MNLNDNKQIPPAAELECLATNGPHSSNSAQTLTNFEIDQFQIVKEKSLVSSNDIIHKKNLQENPNFDKVILYDPNTWLKNSDIFRCYLIEYAKSRAKFSFKFDQYWY